MATKSKGNEGVKNVPLPKGFKLNEYVISQSLGGGGFSMVYLAYDKNGTPLAIKEFFPKNLNLRKFGSKITFMNVREKDRFYSGLRDFKDETEIVMRLKHRNIIEIVNFFEENGTAYIVMPYEYGYGLSRYINLEKENTEEEIIKIILGVFSAVQMFHENKIIHLDLKPGNIWLRPNKEALILDFGTARVYDDPVASLRQPMFTPGYAAPEQYRAFFKPERVGVWTDYYGLGATLYSMLDKGSLNDSAKMLSERIVNKDQSINERLYLRRKGQFNDKLLSIADKLMTLDWNARRAISLKDVIYEIKSIKHIKSVKNIDEQFYDIDFNA